MNVPVLIIGAGPAGLTAAITLAREGVPFLLVERRHEPSPLPRATAVSTRPMELLRSWGLDDEVRAAALDVEWLGWMGESLSEPSGQVLALGLPTREQAALISPTAPACVPQDHLEPILLRHLRSLAPDRIVLGTELVNLHCDADGVRAVLRDVETGASRTVHARYVIGADGAHSRVRDALGIAMHGPGSLEAKVSVVFRAPLWSLLGERRYGLYPITHPEAAGTFVPAGRGDRWLYGTDRDGEEPTHEQFVHRIRLAAGDADLPIEIERTGAFSFTAELAETFRHTSAFLVGDAAHRVTPRGGTGMNTAIRDGHDIGWKLGWVMRGWSGPALLDSYEAERRPIAEHNLARSIDPNGSIVGTDDALLADLGGRIPHIWVRSVDERVSTLDLLGPGLTLFTGPQRSPWDAAAAAVRGRLPVVVRSLSDISARALGVRAGGALLVRPDGLPTGWWAGGEAAGPALRSALSGVAALQEHRDALAAADAERDEPELMV